MKILLDKNKNYYKANLHAHSTNSDGKCTTEELKKEYKKRGYSIVAFTDHEHLIDNSYLDDPDFITITSCEVAIKQFPEFSTFTNRSMKVCHLNFYALDQHNTVTPCYSSVADHFINDGIRDKIRFESDTVRTYSADSINTMIRIAKEKGFIVCYNHPGWSLENAVDYLNYDGMFAVEIYNTSCIVRGHTDDEHVFDELIRAGKKVFCTAADDNHNGHPFDSPQNTSFGGWVNINANRLDYDEIMSALQNGDFYASTGPEIYSLTLNSNIVSIETSDCKKISLSTFGRRCKSEIANENEKINSAHFEVLPDDKFFRIRIEDEYGKRAYTQAYYL